MRWKSCRTSAEEAVGSSVNSGVYLDAAIQRPAQELLPHACGSLSCLSAAWSLQGVQRPEQFVYVERLLQRRLDAHEPRGSQIVVLRTLAAAGNSDDLGLREFAPAGGDRLEAVALRHENV